jgi:nucleotide-binding universal stress UspA family protein
MESSRRSKHGPTIVVGYDGSEPSRVALGVAARRAGRRGRVFVVHAYDLAPELAAIPNSDGGSPNVKPTDAIVDVAQARDADEIILGPPGLGRVRSCWAVSRTNYCTSPTGPCS